MNEVRLSTSSEDPVSITIPGVRQRIYRDALRDKHLLLTAFAGSIGLLVFGWLCDAVGEQDGITVVDRPMAMWIAAHRSASEEQVALLAAKATSPLLLVALVVAASLVLWIRDHRAEAVLLTSAVVGAYAIGGLAKLAEHRARPSVPLSVVQEPGASFPSGHVLILATIALVTGATAWGHLRRRGKCLAVTVAAVATVAMSLDRLAVGAHWLTDVTASLALAVVIGSLVIGAIRVRRIASVK